MCFVVKIYFVLNCPATSPALLNNDACEQLCQQYLTETGLLIFAEETCTSSLTIFASAFT
jgi:hypothetical protein